MSDSGIPADTVPAAACRGQELPTSMTAPLVTTPRVVYVCPLGFFLTPMISRQKVHFSSGCVT